MAIQAARVKPSKALMLHRDEIRRLVQQNWPGKLRVFGSVLHGRDTERSKEFVEGPPAIWSSMPRSLRWPCREPLVRMSSGVTGTG